MSITLYQPNTPRNHQNRVVLFLSIHTPPLSIDSAIQRPQDISSTEKRGGDVRRLHIKVTFKSEICCLDISRHSLVCVPTARSFLLTFPVRDVAMAPCSPGTAAQLLLFVTICLNPFGLRSQNTIEQAAHRQQKFLSYAEAEKSKVRVPAWFLGSQLMPLHGALMWQKSKGSWWGLFWKSTIMRPSPSSSSKSQEHHLLTASQLALGF